MGSINKLLQSFSILISNTHFHWIHFIVDWYFRPALDKELVLFTPRCKILASAVLSDFDVDNFGRFNVDSICVFNANSTSDRCRNLTLIQRWIDVIFRRLFLTSIRIRCRKTTLIQFAFLTLIRRQINVETWRWFHVQSTSFFPLGYYPKYFERLLTLWSTIGFWKWLRI